MYYVLCCYLFFSKYIECIKELKDLKYLNLRASK